MKKQLILGLALVSMVFSCSTDDTADIIINDNSVTNNNGGGTTDPGTIFLSGTYTEDLTLDANNTYKLNGSLIMTDGTTLTIPAGMTLEALSSGANVYIAISQGAKIVANGTVDNPIVLTSDASNPSAGDWGGLIVLGKAPINSVTGTATATSEIASLPYGGQTADDNSGSLNYVRVEYSGGAADGQSENNGFSFYGVGSGTVVNYIQAYAGKDDGIEFFGGTVNASYVSVINAEDDSVDWTEGYAGTLTNVYISNRTTDDKAIEADGYNTDFSNATGVFSKPTVNNLTIVGQGTSEGHSEAVRLRAGTQGIFTNVHITGYVEGFDLDDEDTGNGVVSDDLQVTNVTFVDVTTNMKNDTTVSFTDADFYTGEGSGTATDYATWGAGWTKQ
ncbi:multidrug transporter [Seonamhaeicola sp. MEBiC1930]|uniref:multidrug transporter n=1 Tax=Seonamhaeicola sp. MEBiC01930 TaxID=2976768 RepID=UPI00325472BC